MPEDESEPVEQAIEAEDSLSAVPVSSVEAAEEIIETEPVVCVVTAYVLDDGTGMDVIESVRTNAQQTPCVLFTSADPSEIDTSSFEEVVVEYLNSDLPDALDRLGFITNDVIEHSAQVSFLKPDDEGQRLETLSEYDIDSLPVEESFSRLTDLIASHFDAGVAFIGLIEEEQENFLACHGADLDAMTREETICTHSMLEEDVMVVPDISKDNRFNKNQYLENLGIVSYAGANMTAPNGQVIGQVCLIDFEPRDYSAEEKLELQDFAETAMEILELRKTVREMETDQ